MITRVTGEGVTVICADDGKWLQKGDAYSNTDVYLGKRDSAENWQEIDALPAQDEDDPLAELEGLL